MEENGAKLLRNSIRGLQNDKKRRRGEGDRVDSVSKHGMTGKGEAFSMTAFRIPAEAGMDLRNEKTLLQ